MPNFQENILFRTEVNRELFNHEVDSNFRYVANPWSPKRRYEIGMIVYHRIVDETTGGLSLLHWFIATTRTTKGAFIMSEWELMSGYDSSIINTAENNFGNFVINSTVSGTYSSASNGVISASSQLDTIGFVAGSGISLEFDSTQKLLKISRGYGGGEANSGINVGTGIGIFKDKTGTDLNFKSLISNNPVLEFVLNGLNEIAIDADFSLLNLSSLGTKLLNDLDDVSASPTLNQVLSWNGTNWTAVTLTSPIYTGTNLGSAQYSVFSNISTNDFKFRRLATTNLDPIKMSQNSDYITFSWDGSEVSINDLGDISVSSILNGDVLTYNQSTSSWENSISYNIYNLDGQLLSNRIVDLDNNFLQFVDSNSSTGSEPYLHVEAAPGFMKFIGRGPIPGILDYNFSGDILLRSDNIFINGIYSENDDDEFTNFLARFKSNGITGVAVNATDTNIFYSEGANTYLTSYGENGIVHTINGVNGLSQSTYDKFGNFGINTLTPSHTLHVINTITGQNAGYFEGDVTVDGKLNVTGLIDPTGLVLNEQASIPYTNNLGEGLLWVGRTPINQTIFYTDENGIDHDLLLSNTYNYTVNNTSYKLSLELNIPYLDENKQEVLIPDLNDVNRGGAHSLIYVKQYNVLFAGGRTKPAKIIRFNNPEDLTDFDAIALTGIGNFEEPDQILYSEYTNKVYAIMSDFDYTETKNAVVEIDPVTLAYSRVINDTISGADLLGGSIATIIGKYLYIANGYYSPKIKKYDLDTYTQVATYTIVDADNGAHALESDGTYIYVTSSFHSNSHFIVKLDQNLNFIERLTLDLGAYSAAVSGFTDDFVVCGDYIYAATENTVNSYIVKVDKNDMSNYTLLDFSIPTISGLDCMFTDGTYIYASGISGIFFKFDPQTEKAFYYDLNLTVGHINELATNGSQIFWMGFDSYPVNNDCYAGRFSKLQNPIKEIQLNSNGEQLYVFDYSTNSIELKTDDITITGSNSVKVETPAILNSTAIDGQVLKLVDDATGEVEFSNPIPDNIIDDHDAGYNYESYDGSGNPIGPDPVKRQKYLLTGPDSSGALVDNTITTAFTLKEVVNYKVIARKKSSGKYTFIVPEVSYALNSGSANAIWRAGDGVLEYSTDIVEGAISHKISLKSDSGSDWNAAYVFYAILEYTVTG